METIEQKLLQVMKTVTSADNERVEGFEKANRKFKQLVEKGLVKKRGNNLLSTTEEHTKRQVWFRTQK